MSRTLTPEQWAIVVEWIDWTEAFVRNALSYSRDGFMLSVDYDEAHDVAMDALQDVALAKRGTAIQGLIVHVVRCVLWERAKARRCFGGMKTRSLKIEWVDENDHTELQVTEASQSLIETDDLIDCVSRGLNHHVAHVLKAAARGMGIRDACQRIGISYYTVRNAIGKQRAKLATRIATQGNS